MSFVDRAVSFVDRVSKEVTPDKVPARTAADLSTEVLADFSGDDLADFVGWIVSSSTLRVSVSESPGLISNAEIDCDLK